MAKYNNPESHAEHHASDPVDLRLPSQQLDDAVVDGCWTWISQDTTGPRAGVTMVHIEGSHPDTRTQRVTLPAEDLDDVLSAVCTTDAWAQLSGLVDSALGRREEEQESDPGFICPRFEWCTHGREHREEHDDDGLHAGDDIELHGYGVNSEGTHDRGFLAYLSHSEGSEQTNLIVWGFTDSGKPVEEVVPAYAVLTLLAGVKNGDELERLRAAMTATPLVEKQP